MKWSSISLLEVLERNLFKLFLNDVGLLACQYSDGLQLKLLRGEMNVNYGGIFENAAAQESRTWARS